MIIIRKNILSLFTGIIIVGLLFNPVKEILDIPHQSSLFTCVSLSILIGISTLFSENRLIKELTVIDLLFILIETVLSSAKENRSELQKVLEYYKNDYLKLKAAKYLISNMTESYAIDSGMQKAYSAFYQIYYNVCEKYNNEINKSNFQNRTPIQWGKIENKFMTFDKMVYLPTYYTKGMNIPAKILFLLKTDATIQYLSPNTEKAAQEHSRIFIYKNGEIIRLERIKYDKY
ncbi:hypothetical protein [Bacteroides sp.]|uniref:hypothetical protein n=1 Tax=Bacteroides sp. TaxID=29523 RepID=UPI0026090149|nr:hypothetical protein [Bacteroides sp.]